MSQKNKNSRYKNNRSAQQARQIARNRARNLPRLERLKECMGCYRCGRLDVPGRYLDGHHIDGSRSKYKALSYLASRSWRRLLDEVLGIGRGKKRRGGPVVMWCQRYHEDQIKFGDEAVPCTHASMKDTPEPYRVKTRLPGRVRDIWEQSTEPQCEEAHGGSTQ